MKTVFKILFAIAACSVPLLAQASDGTLMTWNVDGLQRMALVFAPQTSGAGEKHPLVFAFHGHGGNPRSISQGMHLQDLWPEAIVVYPQGLPARSRIDPQGLRPGWQFGSGENADRDLKFFDAMLTDLKRKYAVDDARIYSTGFSNGAIFSYLLWAKRGGLFAAFGICSGSIPPLDMITLPRPALIIAGQNDPLLPFAYQQRSIEIVRRIDGATGPGESCGPMCLRYASSTQTPVVTGIHPGGHVYPPWAPRAITNFFKAHPR